MQKIGRRSILITASLLILVVVSANKALSDGVIGNYLRKLDGKRTDKDESSQLKRRVPLNISSSPPRAFVCITGQLSRLKLENKAKKLFHHWHAEFGVEIDVGLVLSNTTFASKPHFERQRGAQQDFFSMQQVEAFIETIPGVTLLNSDLFNASANPVLNQQYYNQRSAGNANKSQKLKLERVQNHMRQFESMAKCHDYMTQSGKIYDIVHRARDDSGYPDPVPFDKILEMINQAPKTIVSSACQKHKGMNDRGSFLSADAAYDYFNHPIIHMYTQPLPTDIVRTEEYLLYTYSKTCSLVFTNKFHLLKISDKIDPENTFLGEFMSERGQDLENCVERGRNQTETDLLSRRWQETCRTFSNGHHVCAKNR